MTKRVAEAVSAGAGIRFVIVGVLTAVLYFFIFYVLYSQFEIPPYLSTFFAYSTSFGVAYFAHKIWTYESKTTVRESLPKYFLLQLICLSLTAGGTQLVYEMFELNHFFVSVLATLFAGAFSFIVSSLWVFADVEKKAK